MPPTQPGVCCSCRGARSAALLATLLLVGAVESVVLHLWLAPSYPAAAWVLTALSVLTGVWLVGDYHALGQATLTVDEHAVVLDIGWRARAAIPREAIAGIAPATWRDIPDGAPRDYVNLAQPAQPNVLIACTPLADVRLFGVVTRPMRLIGLHVDDPDALVLLMKSPSTS
jgi:hypothetical protein